jgi:hypothetical protein
MAATYLQLDGHHFLTKGIGIDGVPIAVDLNRAIFLEGLS